MHVKCKSGFMPTKLQIISHCCKSKYASQNTQLINHISFGSGRVTETHVMYFKFNIPNTTQRRK